MSVFAKIVTGIFGKKSEKDLKELSPFVDEINAVYNPLGSLSDDELINRIHAINYIRCVHCVHGEESMEYNDSQLIACM